MEENKLQKNTTTQFLIFTAESGTPQIEVRIEGEMIWLTQKLMAELFDTTVQNINMHLTSIFEGGELKEDSVIKEFLITAENLLELMITSRNITNITSPK